MKVRLFALGFFLAVGSLSNAHADERSAVRNIQISLNRIAQEPRMSHYSEARSILDQKLSQLQTVDSQISQLLQVIANPGLRQALMSAQNILQRIARTPTNDPTWTVIYLGEVIKLAGQAAGVLNVREQSNDCIDDVLGNPLRGDTL